MSRPGEGHFIYLRPLQDPWCILDMVLVSMGVFSLFTEHVGEKVQVHLAHFVAVLALFLRSCVATCIRHGMPDVDNLRNATTLEKK